MLICTVEDTHLYTQLFPGYILVTEVHLIVYYNNMTISLVLKTRSHSRKSDAWTFLFNIYIYSSSSNN